MRAYEFITEAPQQTVLRVAPVPTPVEQNQKNIAQDQQSRQRDVDFINQHNAADQETVAAQRQRSYQNFSQDQAQDSAKTQAQNAATQQQTNAEDQELNTALQTTQQQDAAEAQGKRDVKLQQQDQAKQIAVTKNLIAPQPITQQSTAPKAPGTPQ
jgi:hypothetical protein